MDLIYRSSSKAGRWRRRPAFLLRLNYTSVLLAFIIITVTAIFCILPKTLFLSPSPLQHSSIHQQCVDGDEKFLWYAPHSGFSNQLSEFKNAILMAAILNRTLVVPPVLDHHAVVLGSCPKFRVSEPNQLRFQVWDHIVNLIRNRRYVSMADIIDLSSVESDVKFIDFRSFASMSCGVNVDLVCATDDSSVVSSSLEKLKKCGSLLSGYNSENTCIHPSQEDCRSTVWTYQNDDDGVLDSFQADDELKKKRKISFSRMRKDVYKTFGPGSAAAQARVLAFGSLFSAPYKGSESHIDIHQVPRNKRIQLMIKKIEFLPFVPEILNAGKKFSQQTIGVPFLCVQLRLLDGQFKNHWEATFQGVKQKLDLLKQKYPLPIHIFVMTDLPKRNWTGSYLGSLEKDSGAYKLFVMKEGDELVAQTTNQIVKEGRSMKLRQSASVVDTSGQRCKSVSLPDMLLYVQETICSCGSLGFIGTSGSTISESIELMRKKNFCSK